jgi:hypothetical protein
MAPAYAKHRFAITSSDRSVNCRCYDDWKYPLLATSRGVPLFIVLAINIFESYDYGRLMFPAGRLAGKQDAVRATSVVEQQW